MLKGIHLTLMIGPAVPVPAPRFVLDALQSVDITVNDTGPSVFQLRFTISKRSPLETIFLLTGGAAPISILRVVVMVTVGGAPSVLIDGVVTQQQMLPGADAAHSTLSITGEDLSVVMRQIDFSGFPFPATPAEGRVGLMLLKYAWLGIVPMVIPSVMIDVPIPTNQIPSQQGTDLDYINELADKVGYVFYLEPQSTPGHEHRLLGAADQGRRAAAGPEHQHGRAQQLRVAVLHLRQPAARAADGLRLQRAHEGPDSHSDPEHHAAQSAARPGRADCR